MKQLGEFRIFCKIDGKNIPLVTTGTSPFMGASQFGKNARIYRKKFLNNKDAVLEILEACYKAGGRGIELVPGGALNEAAKIMKETYDDFIITGSTFPGPDPKIDELVDLEAKIIFVHGMVSDKRDDKLIKLIEDVSSRDVIPGVAAHNPISTLEFTFENLPDVKTFLIPFNSKGIFMGDKGKLEKIVNDKKDYNFIGMKTLAAGKITPQEAYNYIAKHNICAVAIGMVTAEEAETSTKTALKALQR
ncbi:MAG: hypothetical protein ACFFD5_06930 [Candidatus Thorarchaeota archaeon]